MIKLKSFLFAIETLLLVSPVSSYDDQLIDELVKELRSLQKSRHNNFGRSTTDRSTEFDAGHVTDDIIGHKMKAGDDVRGGQDGGEMSGGGCKNCSKPPTGSEMMRAIMRHLYRDKSEKANLLPACGSEQPLVVRNGSGIISSPRFSDDNLNCSWRIVAPKGMVVKVTFLQFNLSYSEDCHVDFVEIFDIKNNMPVSIGKYCGDSIPMELVKSSGQDLFLFYAINADERTKQFSLKHESVEPLVSEPPISCGRPPMKPDRKRGILSSSPAVPESWPWQVSLRSRSGGGLGHFCGGAIISPHVVLTAARCWTERFSEDQKMDKTEVEIIAGDFDLSSDLDGPVEISKVKEVHIHEGYNSSNRNNDIALVKLDRSLEFSDRIEPLCLPEDGFLLSDECYLTGWGDDGDKTILNQLRLFILPQFLCKQSDHFGPELTDSQFCAVSGGSRGICQGDYGGPFVCYKSELDRWFQFGILSYQGGCDDRNRPGVYTRITSYKEWITNYLGG